MIEKIEELKTEIENDSKKIESSIEDKDKVLYSDIYNRNSEKEAEIRAIIANISGKISNATDVMMLGNMIVELVKAGIKNDENLLRLYQTIKNQKVNSNNNSNEQNDNLTNEEKQELLKKYIRPNVVNFNNTNN